MAQLAELGIQAKTRSTTGEDFTYYENPYIRPMTKIAWRTRFSLQCSTFQRLHAEYWQSVIQKKAVRGTTKTIESVIPFAQIKTF